MTLTANANEVPVKIVGSSTYGRYNTVSAERTFNLFISDDWLVNFAGYKAITDSFGTDSKGRGMFHSVRGNFIIAVIGTGVYRFNTVGPSQGRLLNQLFPVDGDGEVFIDENLSSQIVITNGTTIAYVYNWASSTLGDFGVVQFGIPDIVKWNYVTYQNTYFIFGNGNQDNSGSLWYIFQSGFDPGDLSTSLTLTFVQKLALQTKPDYAIAALRIPSAGNNLMVFGSSVAEIWTQVASTQIYQRQTSVNIDYGCASISTIASSDEFICWLGINQNSAPSIMVSNGSAAQRISTDGIDFLLANILFPADSTAFFYRQDGHLFYQLTFFNDADNITITYDFTTQKFFDLTDWNFNYHPARDVVYFQGETYFISLTDAKLYLMSTELTSYEKIPDEQNYAIPRVRICDTYRLDRPEKFLVDLFTFVIESGTDDDINGVAQCTGYVLNEITEQVIYTEDDLPILVEGGSCEVYRPRIDVTMSKDGGITFSNAVPYYMHNTAHYRAQPRFNRLGACNQITMQLRFWGLGRVVIKNGVIEVRA